MSARPPEHPEPARRGAAISCRDRNRLGAAASRRAGGARAFFRETAQHLADPERVARFDRAVFAIRLHRDQALERLPGWQALRERAAAIKAHTLSHLDLYLERFVERAEAAGARVYFAETGEEANRIVHALCAERGVRRVVKSKSMTTEECGLNPYLEARGVEVADTDLGERIVQLFGEPPSHIVAPAIHRTRREIGDLFARVLGSPAGESDPARLIAAARADLRRRFREAGAGVTGVNFAVAETGTLVVVENEGNSLLTTTLPRLHVAVMGIEKIVPTLADLSVMLRLLARSATGQRITSYTTHYTGPQAQAPGEEGRPRRELHVVLLDNGRTRLLADAARRSALRCIRCGACLNACPVYRRTGGHPYGWAYPGPIGSVLAPAMLGGGAARAAAGRATAAAERAAASRAAVLPFASSLCGACTEVCPVGIDLHRQLIGWRETLVAGGRRRRALPRLLAWLMARPRLYRGLAAAARRAALAAPRLVRPLARSWRSPRAGRDRRTVPAAPRETFHDWWRRRAGTGARPAAGAGRGAKAVAGGAASAGAEGARGPGSGGR
jgi:L-lactate dehydrogenase complex protein LldF